ncbi:MAG: hypothetical protein LIR50_18455 [Bacillota bacterium]|nr:hypothetical protein [Bacillota bacterium]
MKKESRVILKLIFLTAFICLIFTAGCSKGGTPKNISDDEVYPRENIITAKVFDKSHNEKLISLNKNDAEFIIQILKDSKKELVTEYQDGMIELNIQFTDSAIQLLRKDDETIYYVFHNSKINGICYKINSKELSKLILKYSIS